MRTALAVASWLLVILPRGGCVLAAPPDVVVLVTVDTLRADYLDAHVRIMDALASDAIIFDRARSICPATAPSVASMLTGHHRATHGVDRNGRRLPADVTTLAEVLRAEGYRTGAVVANRLLHGAGYEQGFEHFTLAEPDTRRRELFRDTPLLKAAGRLLREFRGQRFFLWLHMMAPHGPYLPPARYLARLPAAGFRQPYDRTLVVSLKDRGPGLLPRYQHLGGPVVPAEYRRRYAGEIRYVDDLLGLFVSRLRAEGVWDDALFVLTADHGESLGEHDLWFQHGWYVYDDTVRVPLVIRTPDRTAGPRRVGASVSLVDLMPTVLALAGVTPPAGLEGASLVPLLDGPAIDRPAYVQNYYENELTALAVGPWKYVRNRKAPLREELYDVAADPGETRDLARTRPEVLQRLAAQAADWLQGQQDRAAAARIRRAPAPIAPDKAEALRALGYAD